MILKNCTLFLILICLFSLVSCASSDEEEDSGSPVLIILSGDILATEEITAASGETITLINHDDVSHTVTSQSALDAFDDTGDFDVVISSEGTNLLTLPEADSGEEFFFYCRFHEDAMTPANGTITIE